MNNRDMSMLTDAFSQTNDKIEGVNTRVDYLEEKQNVLIESIKKKRKDEIQKKKIESEAVSKANDYIKNFGDVDPAISKLKSDTLAKQEALDKIDVTALTNKYDQKFIEDTNSFKTKLDELYVKNEIDVKTRTEKFLTEDQQKVKDYINRVVPHMIRQIKEETRAGVQAQITKSIEKETNEELTPEPKEESVKVEEAKEEETEEEVEKQTETQTKEDDYFDFES
jgi:hypothetical protein